MAKIQRRHLQRLACVYVRQSTVKQVFEHGESTARQYALAARAEQLGWYPEAIEVIDEDLGRSGAGVNGRTGFARLAQGVADGQVGAILATEVSRLARSSQDWQRLLSLCRVAGVVVIDEQTVYDPSCNDDKLLLDLKGTMSEAELGWLALRMQGARRHKAERGELSFRPATGYVWQNGKMVFDPDESVQHAIRTVLERFAVAPSARALVRWARENGFRIPILNHEVDAVERLTWKTLSYTRVLRLLRNPTYAGAYVYGRHPVRETLVDGEIRKHRAPIQMEEWAVCIRDHHEGYISWETYMKNRQKLQKNASRIGANGGAPREGLALLSGLLLCGRCGRRMYVSYHDRQLASRWSYVCRGDQRHADAACWSLPGRAVDRAVEELFLSTMIPDELELSLAVEREASAQADSLARHWSLRLDQVGREARLAERRYKAVDPENRVVARNLERQWEESLRALEEAERQYAQVRHEHRVELSDLDRARIRALARDLGAVWKAETTQPADRKAMVRLVIEALTLSPVDVPARQTQIQLQWRSGAVSELSIPRLTSGEHHATSEQAVVRIRQLAAEGLDRRTIAMTLNGQGLVTGTAKAWTPLAVRHVCRKHGIATVRARPASRRARVPERHPDGRYSIRGAARLIGVHPDVIRAAIRRGKLTAEREPFGEHSRVCWLRLDDEMVAEFQIRRQRGPAPNPLPDRFPDGRYSVAAAAKRLAVTPQTVRRWIRAGRLDAHRAAYKHHRGVWSIALDDATASCGRAARRDGAQAYLTMNDLTDSNVGGPEST